jgi:hypothetical protein
MQLLGDYPYKSAQQTPMFENFAVASSYKSQQTIKTWTEFLPRYPVGLQFD